MTSHVHRARRFAGIAAAFAIGAIGATGMATGLLLIVKQIYGWLRTGNWQSIGVVDGLITYGDANIRHALLVLATEWVGVARVVDFLSMALVLFLAGCALWTIALELADKSVAVEPSAAPPSSQLR